MIISVYATWFLFCASLFVKTETKSLQIPKGGVRSRDRRVLFIGNSYTFFNNMPDIFVNVSAALPLPQVVNVTMVAPGGTALFQHANLSSQTGRDTAWALQDPLGWDTVVLQDQSEVPGGGRDTDDNLAPGVAQNLSLKALSVFFKTQIRNAGAKAVLYSTWGRHDGDAPNADCCGYGDFLGMNTLTTAGYKRYAAELITSNKVDHANILPTSIAPAGRAWELVFNASTNPLDPRSDFTCLYHHATNHMSQNTSARNAGCVLDGAGLGGHPSLEGSYLIALILSGTIFSQPVDNVSWAPVNISADSRQFLQKIAHLALK